MIDARWVEMLGQGLILTLVISISAFAISSLLAFLLALGMVRGNTPVKWICRVYVEFFKDVPLMVLLIVAYAGLGAQLVALGIPTLLLAIVVIGLNEAAYTSEVYRGSLTAIPKAHWEVAWSLGLPPLKTTALVIFPQFIRIASRPTINSVISVVKGSSLASVITVSELTLAGMKLTSITFEPMKVMTIVAVIYLLINVPLGYLGHSLDALGRKNEKKRQPRRPTYVDDFTKPVTVPRTADAKTIEKS